MDPRPDPGNSPPEDWTEPLSDEELAELTKRLVDDAEVELIWAASDPKADD